MSLISGPITPPETVTVKIPKETKLTFPGQRLLVNSGTLSEDLIVEVPWSFYVEYYNKLDSSEIKALTEGFWKGLPSQSQSQPSV